MYIVCILIHCLHFILASSTVKYPAILGIVSSFTVLEVGMADRSGRELSQDEIRLMTDVLQNQGNLVVLTQDEYRQLRSEPPSPIGFSSERRELPKGRAARLIETLTGQPQPAIKFNLQDKLESSGSNPVRVKDVPKLPIFSGDDQKGEVSFEVWRFELKCVMIDDSIDDSLVLQAIRRSLRGTARQMLIPLGEKATCQDIIAKLDTLYGNVSSSETVLQKFYTECQRDNENVTSYGCRLENLLQIAIDSGHISVSARNDMLRSKFWTGLKDDRLKTQTRHKYDSIMDFNILFKEIRAVEQELAANRVKKVNVQSVSDDKVDKMAKQMDQLLDRLKQLEAKIDKSDRLEHTPHPNPAQSNYRNSYNGRGSYHGKPGPRFDHGNFSNRGHHDGGATGRGNFAGNGRGRGQYPPKE